MRSRISALLALTVLMLGAAPSVANLDAQSRAGGNRRDVAVEVGERLFTTTWPAQVMQVIASDVSGNIVVGMRLSGVKFHDPIDREAFDREVASLVAATFAADPKIQEIDLWTTVPLSVGKGLVVSGDLAAPTTRTVFTVSVRRGESAAELAHRLSAGTNVFLDPQWAATAFAKR